MKFAPSSRFAQRLLLLCMLVIVFPVILLTGAEIFTRLLAPAAPSRLFLKEQLADGTKVFRANYLAAKRFFPGNLARKPLPEIFKEQKSAKTLRIFILGESAARGEFLADFSFARILQAVLQYKNPDRLVEVINTGIPAINSWVIGEFADEIVSYQPDLVIIYAGHNEFIGPFGPASIFRGNAGRAAARIGIMASSMHLIQLLKSDRLPESMNHGWKGLDMFSKNCIKSGDPRIDVCQNNWQQNLDGILHTLSKSSIKTIVCSVPVNERDCSPFNSIELAQKSEISVTRLKELFKEMKWKELREFYLSRQAELSEHALANWLYAHALLNLGDEEDSRKFFKKALQQDTFRVRALPSFNQISKELAEKHKAVFADIANAFSIAAEDGIIGEEFIYDHVHLTATGHYLVANSIFSALVKNGLIESLGLAPEFADQKTSLNLLGFGYFDQIHNLKNIIAALSAPPFNRQFSNHFQLKRLNNKLQTIAEKTEAAQAIQSTTEALETFPEDFRIAARLAQVYLQTGQADVAKTYLDRSLKYNPFNIDAINNLGTLFYAAENIAEAERLFKYALKLAPNFADAQFNLGLCSTKERKIAQAVARYKEALEIEPGFAAAMRNLANIHFERKDFADAEKYYRQAFSSNPGDLNAVIGAGNACLAANNFENARRTFEIAASKFPDRPEGFFSLGLAHENFSQPAQAARFYLETLERFNHKPAADRIFNLIAAGHLATDTSSLNQIAGLCCKASNYQDPWHLQLLGVTYAELGKKDEALSVLHQALDFAKKNNASDLITDLEASIKTLSEI